MDESAPFELPSESWVDVHHELMIEAANALTMGFGGTILSKVFPSKATRRRQAFDAGLKARLDRLEADGRLTRQVVEGNEQLLSTYLHATLIAIRHHQQEKREALRNAVLNSALPDAPDDTRQQLFLRWIDELTTWHIRLLRFLQNPQATASTYGKTLPPIAVVGNLPDSIGKVFPELQRQMDLAEVVTLDLKARQLCELPHFRVSGGHETVYAKRTTKIADEFLAFIAEPPDA